MKARIEGEGLLDDVHEKLFGFSGVDHEIPAVPGDDTWNEEPRMPGKKLVTECLLAGAGLSWNEPVWVR